jgi:hypothetical protein
MMFDKGRGQARLGLLFMFCLSVIVSVGASNFISVEELCLPEQVYSATFFYYIKVRSSSPPTSVSARIIGPTGEEITPSFFHGFTPMAGQRERGVGWPTQTWPGEPNTYFTVGMTIGFDEIKARGFYQFEALSVTNQQSQNSVYGPQEWIQAFSIGFDAVSSKPGGLNCECRQDNCCVSDATKCFR